jgi:F-type H+-transporting ATPase subunit epsilon
MLKLEIVTPEREAFSEEVDSTVIPGIDGELGLLPAHAPLVTILQPGELAYTKDGETHHLAVGEGFVEVSGDTVSVMADVALSEDEIDESAVEEALKRAEEALAGTSHEDQENFAALQAVIAKSMAQLRVKRRRRNI